MRSILSKMRFITTKNNNGKNQKNSITGDGNTGNQIADTITNINSNELAALMERQKELRAEKMMFGYSEKNQRALEDVEKAIQNCIKDMGK